MPRLPGALATLLAGSAVLALGAVAPAQTSTAALQAPAADATTDDASTPPEVPTPAKPGVRPELPVQKHYELANTALENGDHDTSLYHYERAVAGQPDDLKWGAEYRQVAIAAEAYDRSIEFFEALAKEHPESAHVQMNLGYAHVDKIPAEGAITQVILANTALTHFSNSLEIQESWLGFYTRGNSYMYWPAVFGRTPLGIADLEKAIALADGMEKLQFHGRAWAALGDGYWRLDQREKMREAWQKGSEMYPGLPELEARLAKEGDELDAYLDAQFETSRRVATHLREIFGGEASEDAP
ncbi:MAG: tetratricopeptide repeat protein [Acidobacteriota bacterium]